MGKQKSSRSQAAGDEGRDRVVYSEFATTRSLGRENPATQRGTPDLPPHQQSLKLAVSRKGRGGKTVTVISGFQHTPETLKTLLKTLKTQCGSGGTLKENTLEIQGDHAQTLLDALKKLGYAVKRSGG